MESSAHSESDVPLLSAEDLVGGFGERRVLDGISLSVARGESLVIMGPSGTGKTVLLKHLIGLLRPISGRLLVDGKDFWALSPAEQTRTRQRYGIAFQEGALFDSMNVFDNIAFPLRRHTQLDEPAIRARVMDCLRLVRLPLRGDEAPSQLSTGMRRRVGFARAIALEPEILLFDEPTSGLDPVMVTVMSQVIVALKERLHPATVTVTHDLACARTIADRIALLFRGRLIAQAPRDQFFELPDPAVRQLVEARVEGPLLPREEIAGSSAAPGGER